MILTNDEAKTILMQVKNLTSVKVYLFIRGHEDKDNSFSITYGELHKMLKMSQTQLTTCLKELVELGLLVKDGRQYKTSHEYPKPKDDGADKLFYEKHGHMCDASNYYEWLEYLKMVCQYRCPEKALVWEAEYLAEVEMYEKYNVEYTKTNQEYKAEYYEIFKKHLAILQNE